MPATHPRIRTTEEYHEAYRRSVETPDAFWAEVAEPFTWRRKWDSVRGGEFSPAGTSTWFDGAKLNITENCLDRHLAARGNKLALIWEPNDPKQRHLRLTYRELYQEVCRFANVLHNLGVEKGDRVCLYMPMIPPLAIAVLACARIGAIHSVVFAGFSSTAIADRVNDAQAAFVITADGLNRGPKQIPVKRVVDEALESCPSVRKVLVVEHLGWPVHMQEGRDVWYHDEAKDVSRSFKAEEMAAEDPLFILYTSGSTGKPKGVVHTTAGYMVWADYTFRNVFQVEENDVYWCTADVGWVTGHSYLLYGPLLAGATTLMFEGVPTYPDAGRFWEVIDKHSVSIFYTAPTAIRSLMAAPLDNVLSYSLDSLRVLGSVGEPINEEAWHWYHQHVGKGRCPIVDTWWQTETAGIMISAMAGITPSKPTHAGLPMPGVEPVLLTQEGQEIEGNDQEGYLAIRASWPGVIRTTWGDHERAAQTYFRPYPGYYFTGDGARRDENGLYRIIGRVDDVINVSGHRFGTAEIENAINQDPHVVESAVVGYPHDVKGQGIYAYVILQDGVPDKETERQRIEASVIETVVAEIGKIARPDKIQIVSGLPKTRSGKIMRRILRKVAEGETSNIGDTTTLLDPAVVDEIVNGRK
ncbi:acetate--CoA ligase [Hymenobacter busanensis]|uniref:Acetate--CoA ligase n=1 Tax=Hymenobacter busanensis TaxID=2607656 RepID=A0A7L4ZUQ6_9BACT|nr:acetate--CoA ligase [Hymenobacter busanensis]KAA9339699.1 acetate--CoA ligase [Hymenobacter busanensis]QHJ06546.1 acetate--CoA ligase [Hymenobacter busanensis]